MSGDFLLFLVDVLDRLTAESQDMFRLRAGELSSPCQQAGDPDLWFAERQADVEHAKALCRTCPVREACLAGALQRGEPWGVWGGESFVDGNVVATKRGRGRPPKHKVA